MEQGDATPSAGAYAVGTVRTLRAGGSPVLLHMSLAVYFVLLVVESAVHVGAWAILITLLAAPVMLVMLLSQKGLQQLCARRRGANVESICLWPLGGWLSATTISPVHGLMVGLVGPLTFGVWAIFWRLLALATSANMSLWGFFTFYGYESADVMQLLVMWGIQVSVHLMLFNFLIAAFPLDGIAIWGYAFHLCGMRRKRLVWAVCVVASVWALLLLIWVIVAWTVGSGAPLPLFALVHSVTEVFRMLTLASADTGDGQMIMTNPGLAAFEDSAIGARAWVGRPTPTAGSASSWRGGSASSVVMGNPVGKKPRYDDTKGRIGGDHLGSKYGEGRPVPVQTSEARREGYGNDVEMQGPRY